jgi:hypothetical protein
VLETVLNWWPVILTVVAGIAAWSLSSYRLNQVEKALGEMNVNGTVHCQKEMIKLNEKVRHQEQRQTVTEQNTEVLVKQVNEMSGDIKVIRALMEKKLT